MLETLHYNIETPKNDTNQSSQAPTVVLLHGLFGSADNLSVISRHLSAQFRVVKIDLPDHGKSPWSEAFSFENYAKQIASTMAKIGIKKAHFVAHSLGGKVAMYLSTIEPDIVDKLIVLDIAPVAYQQRHQNVINGLRSVNLDSIKSRQDAQTALSAFVQDKGTQAFLLKSLFDNNGQWKWRFNLSLLVRDYPLLSDWPLLNSSSTRALFSGPVLFIKGQQSDYILSEYQASILQQFPNASAKIVNAGHWLHAEKPQVVNSLITKFLLGD